MLLNPQTEPAPPQLYEFTIGEAGDEGGGHQAELAAGSPSRNGWNTVLFMCFRAELTCGGFAGDCLTGGWPADRHTETIFFDYSVGKMKTVNRAASAGRLLVVELKQL